MLIDYNRWTFVAENEKRWRFFISRYSLHEQRDCSGKTYMNIHHKILLMNRRMFSKMRSYAFWLLKKKYYFWLKKICFRTRLSNLRNAVFFFIIICNAFKDDDSKERPETIFEICHWLIKPKKINMTCKYLCGRLHSR